MTHKINTANTAAVAQNVHWLPIDQHTPQGVKLQLISRQSGIAQQGTYKVGELFYTHWAPLPTFAPDDSRHYFGVFSKMTDSIKKVTRTPGTWTAGSEDRPGCDTIVYTKINGVTFSVAYCDLSLPLSTNMSNVRLIAAAPDLLEALENLMYYDNGKSEWKAARAAIAKATTK